MKKMPMRVRMWCRPIGTVVIALLCSTQVHAQTSMSMPLEPLAQRVEMQHRAEEQRARVLSTLKTAMAILRDDKPFDPSDIVFGRILDAETHHRSGGRRYLYASPISRSTTIAFSTFDDPEDYSADRSKVKIVPTGMVMRLRPMLAGILHTEIESLLQLDDYWIGPDNERISGNEVIPRSPQIPNQQEFHYRAKTISSSKFPVDVELFYANPVDGSFPPELAEIQIRRAYKILPPEERKQRRLEQQQANRQKYGKMPRVPETTTQPTSPPM
ncbi:hypothetical protein [Burkholderia ubonensis]|uniref:hypothetical protein n=1 Tax=Burkholderia ubonensis TaxID=101571 RepID=UPI0014539505|nr:hypothetical protein [Burkholderia ubonensis]VWC20858.1 hypothetical protein BUB20358_05826 [Burkholderia ubonensis]